MASPFDRLRSFLGIVGLLILWTLIGFGLGEVTLRLMGHRGVAMHVMSDRIRPVDDPVVDYRYVPNSVHWTGNVE